MSRLTRLALAIVRRYPPAWRERYEVELVGYIEDSPTGWRDVFDLARGCVVERGRAFVEPEEHPQRAWMLLGVLWMLPALAWYGALLLVASSLHANLEPPGAVTWAAMMVFLPLMVVGGVYWIRAIRNGPFGPLVENRVPPRWGVGTWLVLFSVSFVFIHWADPPGNPPSKLGWFGDHGIHWFLYPPIIRKALDLFWPARLRMSGQLMHIGGLREQLGWARMELARCESIRPDLGPSALADDARQVVTELEAKLAEAVDALRKSQNPS